MFNKRLSFISCFKWCFFLQGFGRQQIQQVHWGIYNLSTKGFRNIFLKKQTSSHLHDCPILPFTHSILLRSVRNGKLMLDSNLLTKVFKFPCCILSSIIIYELFNLTVSLFFNHKFETLNATNTSDFFLRKNTQLILVKSSINSRNTCFHVKMLLVLDHTHQCVWAVTFQKLSRLTQQGIIIYFIFQIGI